MLVSQARIVLSDLRADIARRGYDAAEKRFLAVLFSDLKYAYSNTRDEKTFNPEKYKQVVALEKQWQEDRRNATGGADSIHEILAQIAPFIPDLPTEVKSNIITIPSQDERDADRILGVLKKRGVGVSL